MTKDLRVASLLPSATEIVCALGLEENLVGVTHEYDFPPGVERKPHLTPSLEPFCARSLGSGTSKICGR